MHKQAESGAWTASYLFDGYLAFGRVDQLRVFSCDVELLFLQQQTQYMISVDSNTN